jgi:hypothetical protein
MSLKRVPLHYFYGLRIGRRHLKHSSSREQSLKVTEQTVEEIRHVVDGHEIHVLSPTRCINFTSLRELCLPLV